MIEKQRKSDLKRVMVMWMLRWSWIWTHNQRFLGNRWCWGKGFMIRRKGL
ncbi:hypothetical protein Godav_028863, partial [Gossypium davidsonii]|nr:hypothetical protein [Gossypium davidsonii]MBA0670431.1 hypothetical protein [Gossypium klotzschianum]